MCIKTLSNNVKIFNGSTSSLLNYCYNDEQCRMLTKSVREEIDGTLMLYTLHIEDEYLCVPSSKTAYGSCMDYLLEFVNNKWYSYFTSPMVMMWFFGACNIPLSVYKMTKERFSLFVTSLFEYGVSCLKAHGSAVGVEAAQSCSERFTQATLNSFHSAGVKKSGLVGIKRIEEVLDAYKSLKVPMMGPVDVMDGIVAKKLIDHCTIGGVIHTPSGPTTYSLCFELLPGSYDRIVSSGYFNVKRRNMTYDGSRLLYPVEGNVESATIAFNTMAITHVTGIKNVTHVDDDGMMIFESKTPLQGGKVSFSNILDVSPTTSLERLMSNDMYWILNTLGISAVEAFIMEELTRVLGEEAIHISPQHISLIASDMTSDGTIRANKYSGVGMLDGVIRKATFQQGTDTFVSAAVMGCVDNIKDVSSQLVVGKHVGVGVGATTAIHETYDQYEPSYFAESPQYGDVEEDENETSDQEMGDVYYPASPEYEEQPMIEPSIYI